jgi:hypothetical protein
MSRYSRRRKPTPEERLDQLQSRSEEGASPEVLELCRHLMHDDLPYSGGSRVRNGKLIPLED